MMAQRKDTMRIIRQDAGFSAKLGFGGTSGANAVADQPGAVSPTSAEAPTEPNSEAVAVAPIGEPGGDERDVAERPIETQGENLKEETAPQLQPKWPVQSDGGFSGTAVRGQVVYVAVSLTSRQARLAEAWAAAARCTVQFLIRRVAQGLRDQVFDDWDRDGMPDIYEVRGARGKHPTSVTLTLRPQFAAELAARHDPLGILGLARVMGPAFRARFEEAFDLALDTAKIQSATEGDEK